MRVFGPFRGSPLSGSVAVAHSGSPLSGPTDKQRAVLGPFRSFPCLATCSGSPLSKSNASEATESSWKTKGMLQVHITVDRLQIHARQVQKPWGVQAGTLESDGVCCAFGFSRYVLFRGRSMACSRCSHLGFGAVARSRASLGRSCSVGCATNRSRKKCCPGPRRRSRTGSSPKGPR